MKGWEAVYAERQRRNRDWLWAGVSIALLAWVLYFVVLPLLRHL